MGVKPKHSNRPHFTREESTARPLPETPARLPGGLLLPCDCGCGEPVRAVRLGFNIPARWYRRDCYARLFRKPRAARKK